MDNYNLGYSGAGCLRFTVLRNSETLDPESVITHRLFLVLLSGAFLLAALGCGCGGGGDSSSVPSNLPPNASGNAVPFVDQPLVPSSIAPGSLGFTLTVNGAGFVLGAAVDFNGVPLATTFVSGRQLTATVPAEDIASAGTASITVVNPAPGGGRSNAAYFPVAAPETTVNFVNAPGSPISGFSSPLSVTVGDFDDNEKPDFAFISGWYVKDFLGNGDGTFVPGSSVNLEVSQPGEGSPTALALGDFNSDGNIDIATNTGYPTNNVPILFGNGDGTFTLSAGATTQFTCTLVAGDFNQNGRLDLVLSDVGFGVNFLGVLPGLGNGTFGTLIGSSLFLTGGSCYIAAGDFNEDGKLDLATVNEANSSVSIMLGNGGFCPDSCRKVEGVFS